jgi:hypothetical protein
MANLLFEMLKKPFLKREEDSELLSSSPDIENIEINLESDVPVGFYDTNDNNIYAGSGSKKIKQTQLQNDLIKSYRKTANDPEVSDAIDEIVDEAIFSPGSKEIIEVVFSGEMPQEIKDKFAQELKMIINKINLNKNIYSMFKSFYVDGQLNIHCAYNDDDISRGIRKISILSPYGLNFNYTKNIWEYTDVVHGTSYFNSTIDAKKRMFDKEEIIRVDSGIYDDNLILSNLHVAIKPANMLRTLEDMLIPMRFTRSVSRRVFNVDVSNLNNKKAEEVMKKTQSKFKYKKFYDLNTGTISNQQHVASLTEDYWFPNRGGEKGTTVDTIDETGNLGELGDLLYFKRKLYTSLKVPSDRINDEGPSEGTFEYDSTSISREEIKFFNFISRLRNQFLGIFYELLKRELIAKNVITPLEWEDILQEMVIKFTSENKFFEKMEREHISESLELYSNIEEMIGKYYSYEYVYKKVLKFSDDEIKDMSEQIEKEKKDPIYAKFYKAEGEEEGW